MPAPDEALAAIAAIESASKVADAAKALFVEIEAILPAGTVRTEIDAAFTLFANTFAATVHPSEAMIGTLEDRASKALSRLGRFAKKVTSDVAGDVKDLVDDPTVTVTSTVTPEATSTTEPIHVAAGKTS